jgi:hypothetical protein
MNWLSDIPYADHHLHNSRSRSEGSGEWLLEMAKYKDWKTRPESAILWLRGSRMSSLELFKFSIHLFFFRCDHRLVQSIVSLVLTAIYYSRIREDTLDVSSLPGRSSSKLI